MMGLLTTLVREVYTHGEWSTRSCLLQPRLATTSDVDLTEQAHPGVDHLPLQRHRPPHFGHARQATLHHLRVHGLSSADYDMEGGAVTTCGAGWW